MAIWPIDTGRQNTGGHGRWRNPPKLSMIATVTNQGNTRWMIIDEAFDADKLIEFLQALIKDAACQATAHN